jgi:hypothetical protein
MTSRRQEAGETERTGKPMKKMKKGQEMTVKRASVRPGQGLDDIDMVCVVYGLHVPSLRPNPRRE